MLRTRKLFRLVSRAAGRRGGNMGKLKFNWGKRACALFLLCATTAIVLPAQTSPSAQTFTTLHSFDNTDGASPENGALVQATNGDLYGTTSAGGANGDPTCPSSGCGTVFKITPSGTLTTLYNFCSQSGCTDGSSPNAGLVQATNGDLYGTTSAGGAKGHGTVFKITLSGRLTTLLSFDGTDGSGPNGLVQATNGNLYGTTYAGGASSACPGGCGTIFKITPSGTLTTLHTFDGTDGANPDADLVQATDGNFHGTTSFGGANSCVIGATNYGCGTVFKITPSGTLTTLHSFDGTDGEFPSAALVQATDGNFYGTTSAGGANSCIIYTDSGCGTVFKMTPSGTLRTLHSFDNTDGGFPNALVQATDGNFYGTTLTGGAYICTVFGGCGTVFKITTSGSLRTLHSFDGTDGLFPSAALVQATNGKFYGTTENGGGGNPFFCDHGCGTVFSLSVGLGPFVETQTTSGKVGSAVKILGTGLTGATSVTFNGKPAIFKVVLSCFITTTVPAGATTGQVKVTTPHGTLSSNVPFRVTPQISSFSPTSGPVDSSVVIAGDSFTGATSVTFGGVKATSFTADSYKKITATVPTGAKTGEIGVATPGGTAVSAGNFTVN
jgi:uncharacterized repeat protein (TIGR03803 family)